MTTDGTAPRRNLRDDAQRARPGSGGPVCGTAITEITTPSSPTDARPNRQFWAGFFAALPDLTATMEDLVISGDRVVGPLRLPRDPSLANSWEFRPPADMVEMRSIDIWRVEDGMFVEHWDELNIMQLLQQMGALAPFGADTGGDAVIDLAGIAALIGILSTGVVYGTDVFCALVQRPALAPCRRPSPHSRHGERASLR